MPVVWLWMLIAGLGVGPTFSVFTIVIQNAVPFHAARRGHLEPDVLPPDRRHDRARLRRHDLRDLVQRPARPADRRRRCAAAGRRRVRPGDSGGSFDFNSLTGVGDLGAAILAAIPAPAQAVSHRSSTAS